MRDILMLIWGAATASCWWGWGLIFHPALLWTAVILSVGILALIVIQAFGEEL